MLLSITIPLWLMWTLGITGGLGVLALAVLGGMFLYMMTNFRPFG